MDQSANQEQIYTVVYWPDKPSSRPVAGWMLLEIGVISSAYRMIGHSKGPFMYNMPRRLYYMDMNYHDGRRSNSQ